MAEAFRPDWAGEVAGAGAMYRAHRCRLLLDHMVSRASAMKRGWSITRAHRPRYLRPGVS